MIVAMNVEIEDIMHVTVVNMAVAVVGKFDTFFFVFNISPHIWGAILFPFVLNFALNIYECHLYFCQNVHHCYLLR